MKNSVHVSVLLNEVVDNLCLQDGDIVVDCTFGGGGHARSVLEKISPSGILIGFDRDETAIKRASHFFQKELEEKKLTLVNKTFSEIFNTCEELKLIGKVKAIYADLGVSSDQINTPERGFSFKEDGPLDMRMNQGKEALSAQDIVNTFDEQEIANIIYTYGEEKKSRFIARSIVQYRQKNKISTTHQLASLIASTLRYKSPSKKHPATKTFQALRIFVNQELKELKDLLDCSMKILQPQGKLAIISFHSLEDRMVKNFFKDLVKPPFDNLPRDLPIKPQETPASFKIVKPFPLKPTDEEIENNPRSRSALLRIIEKC